MGPLPLPQFAEVIEGELLVPGATPGVVIEHVATHSRRLRRQAAFFALPGTHTDGHDYVEAAIGNGAAVVVVSRERAPQHMAAAAAAAAAGVTVIAVESPLRSLQRLAAWWRQSLDARFVAVVGSNGKTVTKDCLVRLLSESGVAYGTPGSYNSQLGVPLAILDCPRTATVAVIEIAVSDPGEMAPLAAMVHPDAVVLTNVGTRWRYRFADRDHQVDELLSIARHLPPDGWLLLGQDDEDLRAKAVRLGPTVLVKDASEQLPTFRRGRPGPVLAQVDVDFPGGGHASLPINAPSDEILADVELAISAAWLLGVDAGAVTTALNDYTPTSTRMEIWRSPTGFTLVRDVATPDPIALTSALRAAKRLTGTGGRTVVVLGHGASPWDLQATTELTEALAAEHPEEIVGVRESSQSVTASAVEALDDTIRVRLFDTVADLRSYLLDHLGRGDVCLVQSPPGSRIADISSALIEAMAPTRVYLDVSAMEENVTTFRRLVGPTVRITAMVKALAYGTDATAVGLALRDSGVDFLAWLMPTRGWRCDGRA